MKIFPATSTHRRISRILTPLRSTASTLIPSRQGRLVRFCTLWLAPFLVVQSFFFLNLLSEKNYLEVFPSELLLPTAVNIFIAAIIALTILCIPKPQFIGAKVVSATIVGMFLVNYDDRLMSVVGTLRAILPILPKPDNDLPLLSLLFFILIVLGATWIGLLVEHLQRKYTSLASANVVTGIFIALCVLSSGQWLAIGRILPTMIQESRIQPRPLASSPVPATTKPDIYYIVLDRYTNAGVLKDQFGYSDTFVNFLKANGFTVKENAQSNYPYTTMSISSTLNASYTQDLTAPFNNNPTQSRTLYHNLIRHSSVIKALKDAGYEYNAIGSWYGASNKNPLANHDYIWSHQLTVFGNIKRLRGIEATEYTKGFFYQFSKLTGCNWWPIRLDEKSPLDNTVDQINTLKQLAGSKQPGGRFIFAHILVPHDPFYFNADGSLSTTPNADNTGKTIRQKYLDQIQFIGAEMQDVVTSIKKQSQDKAVIIFNSDEGAYPHVLNTTSLEPTPQNAFDEGGINQNDMAQWPADWLQMKYGILQATYIPNTTQEQMANLSSVNLFRIVLNSTLGYKLPYLPNCHYALNISGSREYNYVDITSQLTGTKNPQCKQYESVPSTK